MAEAVMTGETFSQFPRNAPDVLLTEGTIRDEVDCGAFPLLPLRHLRPVDAGE